MLCALKSRFPKQTCNFFRKILFPISYGSKLAKNNMKKPSVVKNDKKKSARICRVICRNMSLTLLQSIFNRVNERVERSCWAWLAFSDYLCDCGARWTRGGRFLTLFVEAWLPICLASVPLAPAISLSLSFSLHFHLSAVKRWLEFRAARDSNSSPVYIPFAIVPLWYPGFQHGPRVLLSRSLYTVALSVILCSENLQPDFWNLTLQPIFNVLSLFAS